MPVLREERDLSPAERVKWNALKAEANPLLRGRWDPKGRQPASPESVAVDNLAMKILARLREDKTLSASPVRLKVRSLGGRVALEGVVNDAAERALIEKKVRRMKEVKELKSFLKIKTSNADFFGG